MAAYRKLFARSRPDHPLTPKKLDVLRWIGECGILIPPQIQGLTGMSAKAVQNHLLDLYHLGLVERTGVPRAAFSDFGDPGDPGLLFGRAPTLYTLTNEGGRTLLVHQRIESHQLREPPQYGPNNALFLAHEVQVRDVRVWLERCRRAYRHPGVTLWRDGSAAALGRAHPDALFVYRLREATLVGMVEVDRRTEKSPHWWEGKFARYAALFASDVILKATGHHRARVIVVTPDAKRRDGITRILNGLLERSAVPPKRFWITAKSTLDHTDFSAVWRVAGSEGLQALLPSQELSDTPG